MKHNTNIPGWNNKEILNVIGKYAEAVPENGNILELGALFGRSTYTLGHNKKSSVKLYTLDFWPTINMANHTETNIHDSTIGTEEAALLQNSFVNIKGIAHLPGEVFYKLWDTFTVGIENKIGLRSNTQVNDTTLFPMFNLIFHDASHEYEGVYKDLVLWFPRLLTDGVLIVDDYEPVQFPGVVQAVDQYVQENDLIKEMVTNRNVLLRRKV